ncbi:MAG: discoidin domain-containing protein, partial [Pyrinomonadaceae bacterium]
MKNSVCVRALLAALLMLSTSALPSASSRAYVRQPTPAPPYLLDQSCDANRDLGGSGRSFVPVYVNDVNKNLADYGLIFQDAAQPVNAPETNTAALDSARDALLAKINNTLAAGSYYHPVVNKTVGAYQGWLEGANVSLIMASGLMLADHGRLTPALDSAIRRVIGSYVFNRAADCGLSGGRWRGANSCMDDFAVGASGFAWIAAYKYKRGDSNVAYYVNSAKNLINLTLSLEESVCVHKISQTTWSLSDSRGPCTGTVSELQAATPAAEIISLNHGQQAIGYGLGLMTSISSAVMGLQTAGANVIWTNDQKAVAAALFREAQKHSDATGDNFLNDCNSFDANGTGFVTGASCGEGVNGYKPKMFPVKTFYAQVMNVPVPTTGYQFDVFNQNLFGDCRTNTPSCTNPDGSLMLLFFNRGRQVVYGDLTKCWQPLGSRPALGGAPATPPLAEVAWVQPSYASWGAPDTLTVAGYSRNGSGGVQVMWRDVTTGGPWQAVSYQPPPNADGTWANTIPTSNYCHDYEVYVNYSGSTSNTFLYSGMGSGFCPENSRLSWIQPQATAGFGPEGSLVVAGTAANGPAGTPVKLYWRDVSPGSPATWNVINNAATVAGDGTWSASIPNVNYSRLYEVYAKYDAYASRSCTYSGSYTIKRCETNFALPSNGATVTASSQYGAGYGVSAVNNGDRKGLGWGAGGGWNDATANAYPDWVQIDFPEVKTIDQVNVFTLQDNYGNPIEPVEALTFAAYGLTDLRLEYWDASAGVWKNVPGASVAASNKVWTRFAFAQLNTSKLRVVVTGSLFSYSRITEVEVWGVSPSRYNYASAVNNATVTASSQYGAGYPATALNNGDRRGVNWGAGGGWNDATANAHPDWVQIDFPGSRNIDEINVLTLQDNYGNPAEPTEAMTFTAYGITAFDVQYWNGSGWVNVPGGSVSGNNKVWRRFTFSTVTTPRIRVQVNGALAGYSRITEVEAL